jgi:hypothetical protein
VKVILLVVKNACSYKSKVIGLSREGRKKTKKEKKKKRRKFAVHFA